MWGPRADELVVNSLGGSLKLGLGGGGGTLERSGLEGRKGHGLRDFGGEQFPRGDLEKLMA